MQKVLGYVWQVIFIILYPFLTLFSVTFTGLIRLFSVISEGVHKLLDTNSQPIGEQPKPYLNIPVGEAKLSFLPLKEIHFGPQLYSLKHGPMFMSAWINQAFGSWSYTSGGYTLLQHWPQTEEHLLSEYQLLILDSQKQTAAILGSFKDFNWVVIEQEGSLIVSYPDTNEQVKVEVNAIA
jgi:hypothetical protein